MIAGGGDVNQKTNQWRNTPLHYAARRGHLSVARMLVEAGADLTVRDEGGKTAADWATGELKEFLLNATRRLGAGVT